MKKYTILQHAPAVQIWTYEVVANSEEEAIEMVANGDVDCIDYEVDGDDFRDHEITVIDTKDAEDDDDDFIDPAGGRGLHSHV